MFGFGKKDVWDLFKRLWEIDAVFGITVYRGKFVVKVRYVAKESVLAIIKDAGYHVLKVGIPSSKALAYISVDARDEL